MPNLPNSLTRNITSHSMKNLALHSLLRWQVIILPILTIPLIYLSSKGWENVRFTDLLPGLDQLEQPGPGLVDLVLPLGNRGRVWVACADELVAHGVRGRHPLGANVRRLARKLAELLDQQLQGGQSIRGMRKWSNSKWSLVAFGD